jgi:hypothetical protein
MFKVVFLAAERGDAGRQRRAIEIGQSNGPTVTPKAVT